MSPIVIHQPNRTSLAAETITSFLSWLANLNIKRKVMSLFVNMKYCCLTLFILKIKGDNSHNPVRHRSTFYVGIEKVKVYKCNSENYLLPCGLFVCYFFARTSYKNQVFGVREEPSAINGRSTSSHHGSACLTGMTL